MRRGIGLNNPAAIMVLFLIAGPVCIIWGIAGYFLSDQNTSKYTAVTYGVVTDVEMIREYNTNHYETSYIATVEPEESGIFSSYLSSGKTGYEYEKGEHVEINYDPSDPSHYYIQHANPTSSYISIIIAGAIVLFIGAGMFIIFKLPNNH